MEPLSRDEIDRSETTCKSCTYAYCECLFLLKRGFEALKFGNPLQADVL